MKRSNLATNAVRVLGLLFALSNIYVSLSNTYYLYIDARLTNIKCIYCVGLVTLVWGLYGLVVVNINSTNINNRLSKFLIQSAIYMWLIFPALYILEYILIVTMYEQTYNSVFVSQLFVGCFRKLPGLAFDLMIGSVYLLYLKRINIFK